MVEHRSQGVPAKYSAGVKNPESVYKKTTDFLFSLNAFHSTPPPEPSMKMAKITALVIFALLFVAAAATGNVRTVRAGFV
jgi:hypothetical protein